jgi:hypothetical protein
VAFTGTNVRVSHMVYPRTFYTDVNRFICKMKVTIAATVTLGTGALLAVE